MAQPLNALCLLGLLGLLVRLRWKKAGQRIMSAALIAILLFGFLPIGPLLLYTLERQYPTPSTLPLKIDGIIVLGGAFEAYMTAATGQIAANGQIGRVLCFIDIAKQHPEAKLVYSGGAGDIMNPQAMESEDARKFFALAGLGGRKIFYEEKSRNTYENAYYTKKMMQPKAGENWVLATSAYHMPRSVGIFTKLDWSVIPYECDRKIHPDGPFFKSLPSVTGNFYALSLATKELLGSIAYYFTGKTAQILPLTPLEINYAPD